MSDDKWTTTHPREYLDLSALDDVIAEAITEGRARGMAARQMAELVIAQVKAKPSLKRKLTASMVDAVLNGKWKTETRPGVVSLAKHKFASTVLTIAQKIRDA